MSKRIVFDIEADSLTPTKVWCIVVKDIDNGQVTVLDEQETLYQKFQELADQCDQLIGHNVIEFDLPTLLRLGGVTVSRTKVLDTLVLSRLLDQGREGGHSLEAWGERLKHAKGSVAAFDMYSKEMLEYCINDVELNHKVYSRLMKVVDRNKGSFEEAIKCEMAMAFICHDMHTNGFRFNYDVAKEIEAEIISRVDVLNQEIQATFLPKAEAIREITPKATKHGTISRTDFRWLEGGDLSEYTVGEPFTRFKYVPFNPGSPRQVVDRLWEAGWKPIDKTKTHIEAEKEKKVSDDLKYYGWKVNEVNLATLPEDAPKACQLLVEHILLSARLRTLTEWFNAYNQEDGRIHGKFNSLGTRTHRCSHNSPNMGNIATKKSIKYNTPHLRSLALEYGGRMRELWYCDDGAHLVGCDMEGAHLRIFAHLIRDDDFVKALCEGKKEDGTDIHSLNKRNLGSICIDRDRAKTFIFSFLNGAAAPKVADIFGCSLREARETLEGYVQAYPGLLRLKNQQIPADAGRGYFVGWDGRKVLNDSEHLMMGMYLQNAESVVMKHANILWKERLDAEGIPYRQVNWVHDEWVTEVFGDRSVADYVGRIQAESITTIGERFGSYCPLAGEFKVGRTWLDVH